MVYCLKVLFVCHMHAVTAEARKDCQNSVVRVTEGCEPPCRYGESTPGTLQEQPVFLTAESPPQPLILFYIYYLYYSCIIDLTKWHLVSFNDVFSNIFKFCKFSPIVVEMKYFTFCPSSSVHLVLYSLPCKHLP